MWKLNRSTREASERVLALVDEGGLLLSGPAPVLDLVISRLTSDKGVKARSATSQLAAIASLASPGANAGKYVRLSPTSVELLRTHGAIPGDPGYFRMFVHDNSKRIAGQLQWEHVNLGAEQALSLQTTAVTLALRAAIAGVQQSLERIESKLDQVTRLLRSQRLGDALGDHRTLANLSERVRTSSRISSSDWQTVAAMGPAIARDLEGLRAHIFNLLERDEPGRTTWGRAEEAERLLTEDWLAETLALLAVVEDNFSQWQQLRIAQVSISEPAHLADTVADARHQLDVQTQADQQVLEALTSYATIVADPRLLDGLDPYNSRRLIRARDELDAIVKGFAEQRLLDFAPLAEERFPRFRESVRHLATSTARVAGTSAHALRHVVRRSPAPAIDASSNATPAPEPPGD